VLYKIIDSDHNGQDGPSLGLDRSGRRQYLLQDDFGFDQDRINPTDLVVRFDEPSKAEIGGAQNFEVPSSAISLPIAIIVFHPLGIIVVLSVRPGGLDIRCRHFLAQHSVELQRHFDDGRDPVARHTDDRVGHLVVFVVNAGAEDDIGQGVGDMHNESLADIFWVRIEDFLDVFASLSAPVTRSNLSFCTKKKK